MLERSPQIDRRNFCKTAALSLATFTFGAATAAAKNQKSLPASKQNNPQTESIENLTEAELAELEVNQIHRTCRKQPVKHFLIGQEGVSNEVQGKTNSAVVKLLSPALIVATFGGTLVTHIGRNTYDNGLNRPTEWMAEDMEALGYPTRLSYLKSNTANLIGKALFSTAWISALSFCLGTAKPFIVEAVVSCTFAAAYAHYKGLFKDILKGMVDKSNGVPPSENTKPLALESLVQAGGIWHMSRIYGFFGGFAIALSIRLGRELYMIGRESITKNKTKNA